MLVRDLEYELAPLLTRIFNRTVAEGRYPDPLKITKVIELYTRGETQN